MNRRRVGPILGEATWLRICNIWSVRLSWTTRRSKGIQKTTRAWIFSPLLHILYLQDWLFLIDVPLLDLLNGWHMAGAVLELDFEDKKNRGEKHVVVRWYAPKKHGHHGGRRSATQLDGTDIPRCIPAFGREFPFPIDIKPVTLAESSTVGGQQLLEYNVKRWAF